VLNAHRQRSSILQQGFTLIEMIVTVALVAILLRLAVPSFTTWIRNAQMRSVAEALQNGIRKAQSEAAFRNRQVVFSLTNDEPTTAQLTATASEDGRNWITRSVQLLDSAQFESYIEGGSFGDSTAGVQIAGPTGICFNSQGRLVANSTPAISCTGTAVTYEITRAGAERRLNVTVAPGGEMRMCDPNKSIATAPDGC
jgi:type IV fimbrial biogenesis protein FimT